MIAEGVSFSDTDPRVIKIGARPDRARWRIAGSDRACLSIVEEGQAIGSSLYIL